MVPPLWYLFRYIIFNFQRANSDGPAYPNIYQSGEGGSILSIFGTKFTLPVGSEREDYVDYEEITIPIAPPAPPRASEREILIETLEPWIQSAFRGYKSLNRIQSIIYPIAFETNENILICAPTGAVSLFE